MRGIERVLGLRSTRRRLGAAAIAAGAMSSRRDGLAAPATPAARTSNRFDAVMQPYLESGAFAGAVLVTRGDETLLRAGYGTANRITGAANTPETAYQIASLTKGFTALACVQLAVAGKLSLDDPITAYLPEVTHGEQDGVAATIRDLLAHTAGVPDFLGFYNVDNPLTYPRTFDQLLRDITAHDLAFTPGTAYSYSNSGYIYAGLIVQRVAGVPYEEYLKARIFGPAGMTASFISQPPEPAPPDSKGYEVVNGQPVAVSDFGRVDLVWAAGGISSTVDDLRAWHLALLTETLAPRSAIDAMYRPVRSGYGLGWENSTLGGKPVVGHEGHTIGYDANLSRFLVDDALIVLLSNAQEAPELEITTALAEELFR